jgi:5-bromo-4-chloroindolyl phosphate hydrolysis protein
MMASMVIGVASVHIYMMASMVIGVASMVIGVASMVIGVASMVIGVPSVHIHIFMNDAMTRTYNLQLTTLSGFRYLYPWYSEHHRSQIARPERKLQAEMVIRCSGADAGGTKHSMHVP